MLSSQSVLNISQNSDLGSAGAMGNTVVSPLNSTTLNEARTRSGSAAGKAEVCKHNANDPKCRGLGWVICFSFCNYISMVF